MLLHGFCGIDCNGSAKRLWGVTGVGIGLRRKGNCPGKSQSFLMAIH
jgi:hypothetical protein